MSMRLIQGLVLACSVLLTACATAPKNNLKTIFAERAQAEAFYLAGDFERAVPAYKELIKLAPNLAEAWLRLGNSYSRLGDYSNAIASYEGALSKNPSYVKAWYNLSYVRAQELASTVIQMYQQVPKNDPEAQQIQSLVEAVLRPFDESLLSSFPKNTSIDSVAPVTEYLVPASEIKIRTESAISAGVGISQNQKASLLLEAEPESTLPSALGQEIEPGAGAELEPENHLQSAPLDINDNDSP